METQIKNLQTQHDISKPDYGLFKQHSFGCGWFSHLQWPVASWCLLGFSLLICVLLKIMSIKKLLNLLQNKDNVCLMDLGSELVSFECSPAYHGILAMNLFQFTWEENLMVIYPYSIILSGNFSRCMTMSLNFQEKQHKI